MKKQNGKNVYCRLDTFSGTLSTFIFVTSVLVHFSIFTWSRKTCVFDRPRCGKSVSGTISAHDRCGAVFPTNTMQIAATTYGQFALVYLHGGGGNRFLFYRKSYGDRTTTFAVTAVCSWPPRSEFPGNARVPPPLGTTIIYSAKAYAPPPQGNLRCLYS